MKRNLKVFWLNLIFLVTVVAVSAVWIKGVSEETLETATHTIDGRYHWADVERDVLIEIKDGEYTETLQTGESALREVVSSGYCFRSDGRILLLEQGTDVPRSFESISNGIREIDAGLETPREFERCVHPSALIERGENPYSVDGVQLGMSKADVEAIWGELFMSFSAWNVYGARNGNSVHFNSSGHVHYVSGTTLYEFSRTVSAKELESFGHPDPSHLTFGPSYIDFRIVGDYEIATFNPGESDTLSTLVDPFELDRMPHQQRNVALTYRH